MNEIKQAIAEAAIKDAAEKAAAEKAGGQPAAPSLPPLTPQELLAVMQTGKLPGSDKPKQ